jgi:hypothetical protein
MLTYTQLIAYGRALRQERVLSVYIDGTLRASRDREWRNQVDTALKELRNSVVEGPRDEWAQFETCSEFLGDELRALPSEIGTPGWMAFITKDGVIHSEHLPIVMPTVAVWDQGICAAPYLRALKEARPVVVVVPTMESSTLYLYEAGRLDYLDTVDSRAFDPSASGRETWRGFSSGTKRGSVYRDMSQPVQDNELDRMVHEVSHMAAGAAGIDGWILVGGASRASERIARAAERLAHGRVLRMHGIDTQAPESKLMAAARAGATTLRNAADLRRIAEISGGASDSSLVALGRDETERALEQARVRELYITRRYLANHGSDAESAVREALNQRARVEEVSGAAAEQLDELGGMAARLRYRGR